MKIKLTQEQNDFIVQTFSCKDENSENGNRDEIDSTYFSNMVFIKVAEDKGTNFFEMKHISELPKETLLEILGYMLSKPIF
jgi:hypothetical protein